MDQVRFSVKKAVNRVAGFKSKLPVKARWSDFNLSRLVARVGAPLDPPFIVQYCVPGKTAPCPYLVIEIAVLPVTPCSET